MPRRVVVFQNFEGGEFGLLGEREAPRGSWTGQNVVRYLDGSLGPRSGLVDLAPTSTPTGVVAGFGHNAVAGKVWFVIGRNVYQFSDSALAQAVATIGTNVITATPTNRVKGVDTTYTTTAFVVLDDQGYYIDHVGGSVSALTQMPGGLVLEKYGDRYVAAGKSANPNRVFFSAAGLVDTWDGTDYFDVGGIVPIVGIHAVASRLVIIKLDGSWWILSGVPGVNDVLREVQRTITLGSNSINSPSRAGSTGDGRVWFVPAFGEYPTVFTGAAIRHEDHLTLTQNGDGYPDTGATPKVGVTGLLRPDEVFMGTGGNSATYDDEGLLLANAIWTRHSFAKHVSGWIDGRNDPQRRIIFCDGGAGGVAPRFYAWSYGLTRPPFSSKTFESKTDAGSSFDCSFTLPASWKGSVGEELVASVAIDFKKWNHGFGGNNTFTVTVTPLRFDGTDGTPVAGSFSESASVPTGGVSGEDANYVVAFTDDTALGEGIRVAVTGLVGCAIQRIRVFLDERPLTTTDSDA